MSCTVSTARRLFLSLACAVLMAAPLVATAAEPEAVTVYAAASLKNAMDDVGAAFTARTGVKLRLSYGASSTLARQVENGAPADVFMSADVDWMNYLADRRLIIAATRRDVLSNHLALIAPADSRVSLAIRPHMALAAALGPDGRVAMAGPDVPAGRYGRASLTALGVWPSVEAHLVQAENVRAALLYVSRGEAALGVVYDTDARVEPKVKIVGLLPDRTHPPIVYPAALTARNKAPGAAAFLGFLQSEEAVVVFRKYGFIVLPRPGN